MEYQVTDLADRPPPVALPLFAVGMLGLIRDSWPMHAPAPAPWPWVSLHALFGAALWICVVARFIQCVQQAPRLLPADMRALSRGLSRQVYLLLYLLMFSDLIIGALHGAARAENFQSYLLAGLASVATIHAMAALYNRFATQRAVRPWTGFSETGG
jgi:cytochrome b561